MYNYKNNGEPNQYRIPIRKEANPNNILDNPKDIVVIAEKLR